MLSLSAMGGRLAVEGAVLRFGAFFVDAFFAIFFAMLMTSRVEWIGSGEIATFACLPKS